MTPEEPTNLSRTLTVPEATDVTPTVWLRARQGPNLADLIRQPGTTRAVGEADSIDVLGSAYAAADGDPRTAWTAPQGIVQHRDGGNLELKLPAPTEVSALRLTPSASVLPTHPTLVAVDLGGGPQVRSLDADGGAQTISLTPRVTDTVKLSILDWHDVIDRTALGFDQVKPPGLAEVTALDARGVPIGAADAARNRDRRIEISCDKGPVIGVAGQFVRTTVSTTVGALLDDEPVAAKPCQTGPIRLPAGQQEMVVSPGLAFVVDGIQLAGPLAAQLHGATTTSASVSQWSADRRDVDVPASSSARVIVVPESINPGWTARTADGVALTPVRVNGWQQGWVVPAGSGGAIAVEFASNTPYRIGLFGGLALLPALLLLAWLPARKRVATSESAEPWPVTPIVAGLGLLVFGFVVSGVAGIAVVGAILGVRYFVRPSDSVTVGITAGGLILAGAVLSRWPWRSVEGYVGHSWGVQLLALIAVVVLAVSVVQMPRRHIAPDVTEPT